MCVCVCVCVCVCDRERDERESRWSYWKSLPGCWLLQHLVLMEQVAMSVTHVLVIVPKSSCTQYNGTRGGVEIVIQYEAQPSTVWSIETRHECHYIQYSLISVL